MRVKSETRRQGIVQAAATVFLERGYEAASMAEIAARAGGSKATLYSYFPSKEELFRVVMKTQAEHRMMKAFGSLSPCDDLEGTLQRFGEHYLSVILSQDLLIMRSIVMGEGPRSSMGRLFFQSGPAEGWGQLAAFLEGEMAAGRLRRAASWRAALHLINLLEADFLELFIAGGLAQPGARQIAESVEAAVQVYLRGYEAAPGGGRAALPDVA
ncbi:TetR/AcrR family transcriptional regulator [Chromobacterium paludis]|uniref:TetR/AcrR family transcriptional regulator n=1 Tax=Chromobacterium paludis TaxID=2605945 RepID=A0A5C1DIT5_9NEIS|nr:TetR/AcrR family transcriptional regulator [Chromobacterium paludis]QEL55628.1 TetR/AcrR family transcriptional regulator [Chromobacterium paludis]